VEAPDHLGVIGQRQKQAGGQMLFVTEHDDGPEMDEASEGVVRIRCSRIVNDHKANVLARDASHETGFGRRPPQLKLIELDGQVQRLARDFDGAFNRGKTP